LLELAGMLRPEVIPPDRRRTLRIAGWFIGTIAVAILILAIAFSRLEVEEDPSLIPVENAMTTPDHDRSRNVASETNGATSRRDARSTTAIAGCGMALHSSTIGPGSRAGRPGSG
jgi:hypothetical protein